MFEEKRASGRTTRMLYDAYCYLVKNPSKSVLIVGNTSAATDCLKNLFEMYCCVSFPFAYLQQYPTEKVEFHNQKKYVNRVKFYSAGSPIMEPLFVGGRMDPPYGFGFNTDQIFVDHYVWEEKFGFAFAQMCRWDKTNE